ncbi:MAG TPA: hypothetical protein ENK86_00680 [Campylobacterales bacterium]|nr:hypothetical protein [Campylobacterales bacterium]
MKNITLSLIAFATLGQFAYAGGDINPVTVYETEDVEMATEAYQESTVEEPVYVAPDPDPVPVVVPPVVTKETPEPEGDIANGFYAGLGITGVAYESNCDCTIGSGSEENIAMIARVGYDFNRYIGLEARGMKTVANGEGAEVEHAGLFIKPMFPMGAANLYGLVGAAKTTTTGNLQNVDAEAIALGAGVEVDLSTDVPRGGRYSRDFDGEGDQEQGLGLFVDYERLVVKENAPTLDTISAGVTYDF